MAIPARLALSVESRSVSIFFITVPVLEDEAVYEYAVGCTRRPRMNLRSKGSCAETVGSASLARCGSYDGTSQHCWVPTSRHGNLVDAERNGI
jgi:hypothetical protein